MPRLYRTNNSELVRLSAWALEQILDFEVPQNFLEPGIARFEDDEDNFATQELRLFHPVLRPPVNEPVRDIRATVNAQTRFIQLPGPNIENDLESLSPTPTPPADLLEFNSATGIASAPTHQPVPGLPIAHTTAAQDEQLATELTPSLPEADSTFCAGQIDQNSGVQPILILSDLNSQERIGHILSFSDSGVTDNKSHSVCCCTSPGSDDEGDDPDKRKKLKCCLSCGNRPTDEDQSEDDSENDWLGEKEGPIILRQSSGQPIIELFTSDTSVGITDDPEKYSTGKTQKADPFFPESGQIAWLDFMEDERHFLREIVTHKSSCRIYQEVAKTEFGPANPV